MMRGRRSRRRSPCRAKARRLASGGAKKSHSYASYWVSVCSCLHVLECMACEVWLHVALGVCVRLFVAVCGWLVLLRAWWVWLHVSVCVRVESWLRILAYACLCWRSWLRVSACVCVSAWQAGGAFLRMLACVCKHGCVWLHVLS